MLRSLQPVLMFTNPDLNFDGFTNFFIFFFNSLVTTGFLVVVSILISGVAYQTTSVISQKASWVQSPFTS